MVQEANLSGMRNSEPDTAAEVDSLLTYNFHDLFSVSVAHRRLGSLMRDELSLFRDTVDEVDLKVEEGVVSLPDKMLSSDLGFGDSHFVFETPSGKVQFADGLLRAEPRVSAQELLVQWVENLMGREIPNRGACLVHASAVSRDGVGYLFPAWAHTGKTNLALGFLLRGYDYMADDWCFVSSSGDLLSYPRWVNLFAYNFDANPGLMLTVGNLREFRAFKRQLAATRFARSLDESSRVSRSVRRRLLDHYFANVRVPVDRAIPGCSTALRAHLSKVCLLTTSRSGEISVSDIPSSEVVKKVALCAYYERTQFYRREAALAYAGGRDADGVLTGTETDVLGSAFETARCVEVTLPRRPNPQNIDDIKRSLEEV